MKKVLILGEGSYIGQRCFEWLLRYPDKYEVELIGTRDYVWKKADYTSIDSVLNFAGIAHVKSIKPHMERSFYSVNRDIAIEMCQWAKQHGVKQFVQVSSMNVYGDFCGVVSDKSNECPSSFYGNSKLQGDIGTQNLADCYFSVANIRPPFVYGKGCKGNYNTLKKIALVLRVFPTYRNKKSMIYIDNLCEFFRLTIETGNGGIYTPQNRDVVSTSDLVREIAINNGHSMIFTSIFNWAIPFMSKYSAVIKRAFGDDSYSLELSDDYDWQYCLVSFVDSIKRTEK